MPIAVTVYVLTVGRAYSIAFSAKLTRDHVGPPLSEGIILLPVSTGCMLDRPISISLRDRTGTSLLRTKSTNRHDQDLVEQSRFRYIAETLIMQVHSEVLAQIL